MILVCRRALFSYTQVFKNSFPRFNSAPVATFATTLRVQADAKRECRSIRSKTIPHNHDGHEH